MSHEHANDNGQNDVRAANDPRLLAQVVIADDDPDALELLDEVLRPLTVQVHRATSGAELVVLLADHGPFDLIVTDIDMPWMEGIGVIRSARASAIETPVLFVSGIARPDLEAAVTGLGNTRLLRKPIAVAALRSAASEMLVAWQARRHRAIAKQSAAPSRKPRGQS